jgi:glycosyltransferase involved in cell wall biosynthesis
MKSPTLKIALLGTRGVPARYGGFETFAEELGVRLVERGHEVTVYCRRFFDEPAKKDDVYRGIRQRWLPTFRHKYLETPIHSLMSFINLFSWRPDVVLLCNAANSPFSWLVRLRGLPLAINVDGIERKRSKWNALGRAWYWLGEFCSVLFATRVVADAQVIADYYKKTYKVDSSVIAYGGRSTRHLPGPVMSELGVESNKFILYVSRLEPENNALGVIKAYGLSKTELPLVIVGDAPYASAYKQKLLEEAREVERANRKKSVKFAGFRFGAAYEELQSHCAIYIQATEVGGTHPALVEAMTYGNCIIANGTPENVEVLANAGEIYPVNNFQILAEKMDALLTNQSARQAFGAKAAARAHQVYSWDVITGQYEALFKELANIK